MDYIEMKTFLSEQNKTHEGMQAMWDFCIKNNHPLISQLDRCGKSWTDMNTTALATLEKEYEKLKDKVNS